MNGEAHMIVSRDSDLLHVVESHGIPIVIEAYLRA